MLLLHFTYEPKWQFSAATYAKIAAFFSKKKAEVQKMHIQTGASPLYIYVRLYGIYEENREKCYVNDENSGKCG